MIINRTDFDLDLLRTEINLGGYAILDEQWRCENCCDPFSRLYYVTKGSGFLKYGDIIVKLQPGNVYLVPATLTFSYGCQYLEKLFFHISMTKTDMYDLLSGQGDIYSMPFPVYKIEQLKALSEADDYISFLSMKGIIYKTISDFAEKYNFNKITVKEYSKNVKKVISYIHKNPKISLSVKEISKNMYVSESSIRNQFKNEVGTTIGEYIDDVVLFEAKKFLKNDGITIKEISERLDFCDQFYFSRRFKEKFGKTPSQYKKEII